MKFLTYASIFFLLISLSCNENPFSNPENNYEEGSWVKCSPYDWTHDGKPYTGLYCKVYSDGISQAVKKQFAEFADTKFAEILQLFNFQSEEDLLFPPGYDKIDVYINRYHEERIAAAYWGSIIITMGSDNPDINRYDYLFKHELTHQFQFLIEGKVNLSTEIWFSEGIAIYGGGGLWGVRCIQDLEAWKEKNAAFPGQGNPICIHIWDDFPPGSDITGYYFYVFDLTMRYFLDPNGLGKSTADVLNLFYDLRNGIPFPVALMNNFNLDLIEFEKEYYAQMRAYLSNLSGSSLLPQRRKADAEFAKKKIRF